MSAKPAHSLYSLRPPSALTQLLADRSLLTPELAQMAEEMVSYA